MEAGASSAALHHGNLMAQRDRFQYQRGAGSGIASGDRDRSACGPPINAGHRRAFETTNEFLGLSFEDGQETPSSAASALRSLRVRVYRPHMER
jgi:hypothetical protein